MEVDDKIEFHAKFGEIFCWVTKELENVYACLMKKKYETKKKLTICKRKIISLSFRIFFFLLLLLLICLFVFIFCFFICMKNVWRKFWYNIYLFSIFKTEDFCLWSCLHWIITGTKYLKKNRISTDHEIRHYDSYHYLTFPKLLHWKKKSNIP